MPRALTIHHLFAAPAERQALTARLRARHAHFASLDIRYWVFEEAGRPGAFVEFTEARDPEALASAHAAAPGTAADPARLYTEVEL